MTRGTHMERCGRSGCNHTRSAHLLGGRCVEAGCKCAVWTARPGAAPSIERPATKRETKRAPKAKPVELGRNSHALLDELVQYAAEAWALTHQERTGENPALAPETRATFVKHAHERLAQVLAAAALDQGTRKRAAAKAPAAWVLPEQLTQPGPGIGALMALLGQSTEGRVELLVRVLEVLNRQGATAIDVLLEAPAIAMMPASSMRGSIVTGPYLSIPTLRGRPR